MLKLAAEVNNAIRFENGINGPISHPQLRPRQPQRQAAEAAVSTSQAEEIASCDWKRVEADSTHSKAIFGIKSVKRQGNTDRDFAEFMKMRT